MEPQPALEANPNDNETTRARVFLRERFLRFIAKLSVGQPCSINMQEDVTVKAKLRAFDMKFDNIIVEKLETPFLPVEKAIMRSSDIISIHMKSVPAEMFM